MNILPNKKEKSSKKIEDSSNLFILHLSDLHFSVDNPADIFHQEVISRSLLEKLEELGTELRIDLIIFTGDLTYSGKVEEYNLVEKFCKKLRKVTNVTKKSFFFVLGNHDIDRRKTSEGLTELFDSFLEQFDITSWVHPDIKNKLSSLLLKFEAFTSFANKVSKKRLDIQKKFYFVEKFTKGEYSINLLGLNSALFAGYNGDENKLDLSLYQVESALKEKATDACMTIAFFHHPLELLTHFENICGNMLMKNCDLILTGHKHKSNGFFIRGQTGEGTVITTGACYEKKQRVSNLAEKVVVSNKREKKREVIPYSFDIIEIDLQNGDGHAQFYEYDNSDNCWSINTKKNKSDKLGRFHFEIPSIKKIQQMAVEEERMRREERSKRSRKTIMNLAIGIAKDYFENRHSFPKFCGRKDELLELVGKMHQVVEVTGVGGIGKSTLCEVGLLIYKEVGKQIACIGTQEGYASGSGYEEFTEEIVRTDELTLDSIINVLKLDQSLRNQDELFRINAIIRWLEQDSGRILFIDNYKKNSELDKLLLRANTLSKGCIIISARTKIELAAKRVVLKGLKVKNRVELIDLFAERLGKTLTKDEIYKIGLISEGHPIAIYLLISTLGLVPLSVLDDISKGFSFAEENTLQEYIKRVIKEALSPEAFRFLQNLAIIEEVIDWKSLSEVYSLTHPELELKKVFSELRNAHLVELRNDIVIWQYNQIKEAIFVDSAKFQQLAIDYYKYKEETYENIEYTIKKLYHLAKKGLYKGMVDLYLDLVKEIDSKNENAIIYLSKWGEVLIKSLVNKEKVMVMGQLGNTYLLSSTFRNIVINCKRAIELGTCILENYIRILLPRNIASTYMLLGNAYGTIAKVIDKEKNIEEAIIFNKKALTFFTKEDYPYTYSQLHGNLGINYRILSEVKDKKTNCEFAIKSTNEAVSYFSRERDTVDYISLKIIIGNIHCTLAKVNEFEKNINEALSIYLDLLEIAKKNYPFHYYLILLNLGSAYIELSDVENKEDNCKLGIKVLKEALTFFTKDSYPYNFAKGLHNLGLGYLKLSEVKDKETNCELAIKVLEEAFTFFTDGNLAENIRILHRLGEAYNSLATLRNKVEDHEKTLSVLKKPLRFITEEQDPYEYAFIQYRLGIVYSSLAELKDKEKYCRLAIESLNKAKSFFLNENYPEENKAINQMLKYLFDYCSYKETH